MSEEDNLLGRTNESSSKSAFHGAMQYLERINLILQEVNYVSVPMSRDYKNATTLGGIPVQLLKSRFYLLRTLFMELSSKMSSKEQDDYYYKFDILKKEMNLLEQPNPPNRSEFISMMDLWELQLRTFANKKGLIMPDKRGAGEAASTS